MQATDFFDRLLILSNFIIAEIGIYILGNYKNDYLYQTYNYISFQKQNRHNYSSTQAQKYVKPYYWGIEAI